MKEYFKKVGDLCTPSAREIIESERDYKDYKEEHAVVSFSEGLFCYLIPNGLSYIINNIMDCGDKIYISGVCRNEDWDFILYKRLWLGK